jgi:nucleoside-diphosphate-sugar epimerase
LRVMVTGASGFVGRWSVAALRARGVEVAAVGRRPPQDSGTHFVACDLLDRTGVRGAVAEIRPDAILHLAWTVEHGKFWTAPDNLDWVGATLALLRLAREAGVRRFVGVGTCFEYASHDRNECDELTTPIVPTTLYAVAKDAVRRIGTDWFEPSFAWARLFYMFGPGENEARLVASIASRLARGEPAPLSQGRVVRDFLHVRDVGSALAAVTLADVVGPVNIASGDGRSIRSVAEQLALAAGRPDLLRIGELPDRAGEPPHIVGGVRRLHEEIGFCPSIGFEEGLADTYAWWAARAAISP